MQGVLGYIVFNAEGTLLKTSFEVLFALDCNLDQYYLFHDAGKPSSASDQKSDMLSLKINACAQEDVAKTYASLLPDLSYLGHNMVRVLDPEVGLL